MGWGVPYLLQWALNNTGNHHFKEKSKKKVPWAIEYQNDGLCWISRAPPELVAVQMLLLYAPPEPEICCHVLPVAYCSAIAVLAPPELSLLASPELTPCFCGHQRF
jgi:hypothetical protein